MHLKKSFSLHITGKTHRLRRYIITKISLLRSLTQSIALIWTYLGLLKTVLTKLALYRVVVSIRSSNLSISNSSSQHARGYFFCRAEIFPYFLEQAKEKSWSKYLLFGIPDWLGTGLGLSTAHFHSCVVHNSTYSKKSQAYIPVVALWGLDEEEEEEEAGGKKRFRASSGWLILARK